MDWESTKSDSIAWQTVEEAKAKESSWLYTTINTLNLWHMSILFFHCRKRTVDHKSWKWNLLLCCSLTVSDIHILKKKLDRKAYWHWYPQVASIRPICLTDMFACVKTKHHLASQSAWAHSTRDLVWWLSLTLLKQTNNSNIIIGTRCPQVASIRPAEDTVDIKKVSFTLLN